jgi:hypothetical protein
MATSRSNDDATSWLAGVFLYAGRRDPTWKVPGRILRTLQKLWDSFPVAAQAMENPPAKLGYRGCFVRGSKNLEWTAFNGFVHLKTPSGIQTRLDVERVFEKGVLASAPKGLLPESLLEGPWAAD